MNYTYILSANGEVIFEADTAYECERYGDEFYRDGYTISMKKHG